MKLAEIKKTLGGKGKLIWAEASLNFENEPSKMAIYIHPVGNIIYDKDIMYPYESFINKDETRSRVVKTLCERFSTDKVFAYQESLMGTDSRNPKANTVLATKYDCLVYDCDCHYLLMVKDSLSKEISTEGETIILESVDGEDFILPSPDWIKNMLKKANLD